MSHTETGTTISVYIIPSLLNELDKFVDKNKDIYRSTLISEAVALLIEKKKKKIA